MGGLKKGGFPAASGAADKPKDAKADDADKLEVLIPKYPGRLIFLSMAACGVVPVQLTRPHMPSASLTNSSLLYCVTVNLLVLYATLATLSRHLPGLLDSKSAFSLHRRLECMDGVVSLAPLALMPIMWVECIKFGRKARQFGQFQEDFRRVTNTQLLMEKRCRMTKWILAVIYVSHAVPVVYQTSMGRSSFATTPAYVASYMFLYHVVFWHVSWVTQLRIDAHRIWTYLKGSPKAEAESRLRESRRLWILLRDIQDGCTALGWLIFFLLVFLFLMMTLALYQVISLRRHGYSDAAGRQAISGMLMVIAMYALCNESHKCVAQMNGRFIKVLDEMCLSFNDDETCKAINLFYLTISANPFKVSLGGFTNCNRPLVSTVISATVTYIVVLVQFQNVERDILQQEGRFNASHL